jgi:hypothetical protein
MEPSHRNESVDEFGSCTLPISENPVTVQGVNQCQFQWPSSLPISSSIEKP